MQEESLAFVLGIIAREFCFNVERVEIYSADPRLRASHDVELPRIYTWKSKQLKGLYRNAIRSACMVSKTLYRTFSRDCERMMYRTVDYGDVQQGPALDRMTKCLMFFTLATAGTDEPRFDAQMRQSNTSKLRMAYTREALFSHLPRAIPANLTSMDVRTSHALTIASGVLPNSLIDFQLETTTKIGTYHMPPNLKRFRWRNWRPQDVPIDWTDSIVIGLPSTLRRIALKGVPIGCSGCDKCIPYTPLDRRDAATTLLPPALDDVSLFFRGLDQVVPSLKLCAIPAGIKHLAVTIDSDVFQLIRFSNCSFPLLESLFVRGLPCGLESMTSRSKLLKHLVCASINIVGYGENYSYAQSRLHAKTHDEMRQILREHDGITRRAIPIRVPNALALTMLTQMDCSNDYSRTLARFGIDASHSIEDRLVGFSMYRPSSDVPQPGRLVTCSRSLMALARSAMATLTSDQIHMYTILREIDFERAIASPLWASSTQLRHFTRLVRKISGYCLYNVQ